MKVITGIMKEMEKEKNLINGEIIFKGEFSIGKRWNGKGKEYNDVMN